MRFGYLCYFDHITCSIIGRASMTFIFIRGSSSFWMKMMGYGHMIRSKQILISHRLLTLNRAMIYQ